MTVMLSSELLGQRNTVGIKSKPFRAEDRTSVEDAMVEKIRQYCIDHGLRSVGPLTHIIDPVYPPPVFYPSRLTTHELKWQLTMAVPVTNTGIVL